MSLLIEIKSVKPIIISNLESNVAATTHQRNTDLNIIENNGNSNERMQLWEFHPAALRYEKLQF